MNTRATKSLSISGRTLNSSSIAQGPPSHTTASSQRLIKASARKALVRKLKDVHQLALRMGEGEPFYVAVLDAWSERFSETERQQLRSLKRLMADFHNNPPDFFEDTADEDVEVQELARLNIDADDKEQLFGNWRGALSIGLSQWSSEYHEPVYHQLGSGPARRFSRRRWQEEFRRYFADDPKYCDMTTYAATMW